MLSVQRIPYLFTDAHFETELTIFIQLFKKKDKHIVTKKKNIGKNNRFFQMGPVRPWLQGTYIKNDM